MPEIPDQPEASLILSAVVQHRAVFTEQQKRLEEVQARKGFEGSGGRYPISLYVRISHIESF